jgi:hypothetical protein
MTRDVSSRIARLLLAGSVVFGCAAGAHGQTLVDSSAEARFQLDVHVPDAALAAYLPPGWMPNVSAQGAA